MREHQTNLLLPISIAIGLTATVVSCLGYVVYRNILSQQQENFRDALRQEQTKFEEQQALQRINGTQLDNDKPLEEQQIEPEPQLTCSFSSSSEQASSLQDDFISGGFASYSWTKEGDDSPYASYPVYLIINGGQMCVHHTVQLFPFVGDTRCGGLGCDLKPGEPISVISFIDSPDGELLVDSADGSAAFMRGAACEIAVDYLPVLTCDVPRSPLIEIGGRATIRFAPAS